MKLEDFKIGEIWKKTWLKDGTWIIFKVIGYNDNSSVKCVPIANYGYGRFDSIIVSDFKNYKFKKLTKEQVFLEVL